MRKTTKILLITLMLLILAPMSAFAGILVLVDGTPLDSQSEPVFISGKLMVPMRSIFERLGAEVTYNSGNITALLGTTEIKLQINQLPCKINNRPDLLPVAPVVNNGTTMVPLRFVSQALSADVEYLNEHQLVLITSPNYREALKTTDDALIAKVKEYNIYKNLTMTNEKSIAGYRAVKNQLMQDIDALKKYNQQIKDYVLTEDARALTVALADVNKINGLKAQINQTADILAKDTLTNQLSKDLRNYHTLLAYVYTVLVDEKKISSLVKEKMEATLNAEQTVTANVAEIEQKVNNNLALGRRGVN